ncbi:MAG TPA: hypothetical protein VMU18_06470 [Rhodoblastus sp.]|nr:hypothetical protein [Rhodoblastus sp.]
MNRLKIILLVALCGVNLAAAAFAWRGFAGADAADDLPARSAALVPAAPSDAPVLALGEDSETLARPLFSRSRRPQQASAHAEAEASASPPPAGLKLHGVIGYSRQAQAFVTSNASTEGKWLKIGEKFENWTVETIDPQEIALRQSAEILRVGLDYDETAQAQSAFAPPPPKRDEKGDDRHAAATPPKMNPPDAGDATRIAKRNGR